MPRPRQRDVEQAQILAQPLALGRGHRVVAEGEVERAGAVVVDPGDEAAPAPVHLAAGRRKRQEHHRILQPLGLVHGDHLHQLGIAFQPHDPLLARAADAVDLLGQPADLGLLAIELGGGGLQQLAQVQQVGQPALAVRRRVRRAEPARRQVQRVQRLPHQRQHALPLPDAAQALQLREPFVPGLFIGHQPGQLGQVQAGGRGGVGGAGQWRIQRIGHRLQPAQQVRCLSRREHRILV